MLDAVRSILADGRGDVEVLVIDQSCDAAVEAGLAALAGASHVRYVRTDTRGLSVARNLGLRLAAGATIAMTDDDCTVAPEWAAAIERAFAEQPRAVLLFGNVVPAPFDPAAGFIPGYERKAPYLATSLSDKMSVEGIGACMALRRDAVIALGGFDEMLGAGGPFYAGEDVDLTLRVLAAGHGVYETPAVTVIHSGFHSWAASATLIHRYWFGAGAAHGKHVRAEGLNGVGLLGRLAWRFATGPSPVASRIGLHNRPWIRLESFVSGLARGMATPVDRTTGHFRRELARSA